MNVRKEAGLAALALFLTASAIAVSLEQPVDATTYHSCQEMNCKTDQQTCSSGGTIQPGCWMTCPDGAPVICDFKP
jgi:hypothetical protein